MTARRKLTEIGTYAGAPYDPPFERQGPTYAHDLARHRNENLNRQDIEWAVSEQGQLYLRDKPEWSARRTVELQRQSDDDRERWKRAQRIADATPW